MLKRNTELIKDEETRLTLDFIQEQALGKCIELSVAPVATTPLLQDGEWGFYSGKLYFRVQMIVYVITPSSVITIT